MIQKHVPGFQSLRALSSISERTAVLEKARDIIAHLPEQAIQDIMKTEDANEINIQKADNKQTMMMAFMIQPKAN